MSEAEADNKEMAFIWLILSPHVSATALVYANWKWCVIWWWLPLQTKSFLQGHSVEKEIKKCCHTFNYLLNSSIGTSNISFQCTPRLGCKDNVFMKPEIHLFIYGILWEESLESRYDINQKKCGISWIHVRTLRFSLPRCAQNDPCILSACCSRSQFLMAVKKYCSYQLTPPGWPGRSIPGLFQDI